MAPIIRQPTGGGGGLEPADIGVTVQGYDSDLAAIAALSTTGLANRTGAGTWTTDSTTYLSTSAAASTYQPLDSDLTAIAALATTANGRSLLTISQAITVSNSAPGSPAAGDLWYNPSTGILGFWRSPYWLNTTTTTINFPSVGTVNLTTVTSAAVYAPYNLYWESFAGSVGDTSGTPVTDEASVRLVEILAKSQSNGTGSTRITIFSQDLAVTGIFPNSGPCTFSGTINTAVVAPTTAASAWLSYVFTVYGVGISPGVQLSARARLIL